jgi:hypothetical protein
LAAPPTRTARLGLALAFGVVSGLLCWFYRIHVEGGAGDFTWILHAAEDLLGGRDPYANHSLDAPFYYPLPAAVVGIPLVGLDYPVAGAIFFGVSSALLTYGIAREGNWRLLFFLSVPYWFSLRAVQWSPLLTAIAFFPLAMPLALAKPHTALPVALTSLSRRGIALSAAIGVASLLFDPTWPLRWVQNLTSHSNFIPLLTPVGPALLLAGLRYKDKDSWLLLIAAVTPQRFFYDQLYLWLIPRSAPELIITAIIGWVGYRVWFPKELHGELITTLCFYMPMLVIVLRRGVDMPQVRRLLALLRVRLRKADGLSRPTE